MVAVDQWLQDSIIDGMQIWADRYINFVRAWNVICARQGRRYCGREMLYVVYCVAREARSSYICNFFLRNEPNLRVLRNRQGRIVYHRVSCNCIREARDGPDGPLRLKLDITPLYDSRVYKHLVWVNGGPPSADENHCFHHPQTPQLQEDDLTAADAHPLAHVFKPCQLCHPERDDQTVIGVE